MYEYNAKVLRVVDGDTVDVEFDLGFNILFRERVRLDGIDTPEIFSTKKGSDEYNKGMEAKTYVEQRLSGKNIIIQTKKDKKGKYGRYIGTILVDGINLNEELVTKELAVRLDS